LRWLTGLRIRWNDRLGTLVAVTTLLLAGLATLATFQSATYGNDALLAQTELTNCWSYYQAKSIKQHLFQLHRDMLALEPSTTETAETLARYEEEIARYRQEKYALMQKAAELERTREEAENRAASFGESLLYLQVGLLLSSLASVGRVPYYWYGALIAGAGGAWMLVRTWM
jgi:hypothetical protein